MPTCFHRPLFPSQAFRNSSIGWCVAMLLLAGCRISAQGAEPGDNNDAVNRRALVLAHYMPWYEAKPSSERWGWHWTMNHFDPDNLSGGKRDIASKFYPLIGPYDSGDPYVLEYHLLLMKLAGIDGVIVDWYGLTSFRDYAILHRNTTRLLQQCERLKMKFVICYEDQTIPALVQASKLPSEERVSHAVKELDWLGKYWFRSGSYVKLDRKPVLLSFGHTGLTNEEWSQCLSRLDFPIAYFSQDFRRKAAIGGFGWPAPKVGIKQVARFFEQSSKWPAAIPVAFPRFHDIYRDAKVSEGYPRLPDDEGNTFRTTMQRSLEANAPMIQLATWNDWGEGTQIEPSVEFGYRDLEFLQRVVRQPGTVDDAVAKPDDLRIPLRLLELRRASVDSQSEADAVSDLVCQGRIEAAKQLLDTITVAR